MRNLTTHPAQMNHCWCALGLDVLKVILKVKPTNSNPTTALCHNPQAIWVPQHVSRVSLGKGGLRRSLLMDTQQCCHCPELQASPEQ